MCVLCGEAHFRPAVGLFGRASCERAGAKFGFGRASSASLTIVRSGNRTVLGIRLQMRQDGIQAVFGEGEFATDVLEKLWKEFEVVVPCGRPILPRISAALVAPRVAIIPSS